MNDSTVTALFGTLLAVALAPPLIGAVLSRRG